MHSTQEVIAASTQQVGTADVDAFVGLVRPLLSTAYGLAVAMLRSETEAEDAVQEAAYKAWRNFGDFRTGADMKPWLLTIVANECRRMRRSRWWSVVRSGGELDVSRPPELDAQHADLRRALYRLPHDQRLAIVLRYYLDLSFKEVAEVMKTTPKAAKSCTYRALERLRMSPEVLFDE